MVDDMRVYIANLGKYNEGYLVGDWFSFPIDEEEVAERIGLNSYYEESSRQSSAIKKDAKTQADPLEKAGIVRRDMRELPE